MDLNLSDKAALVTGGSKGIGEAVVRTLLAEGARVANVNRAGPEGESLAAEFGDRCVYLEADLVDLDSCRTVVDEAIARFGQLDIVVNNAGVNDGVDLTAGPDQFSASLGRNLTHYYAIVHHALPALKQSRGVVINIGSKVAVTGQGGTSGYAAAKGAINALTREWAVDLAPHGIRVNAVLPAETWTPLYEKWLAGLPDGAEVRASIEKLIPLENRFTSSQELADMVVFLASPRSGHTTGQIVFVDGGYTHLDRKCTAR